MTDNSVLDLDKMQALFERHEVFANPSEIHGVIAGLLCGGTKANDSHWIEPIADFFHQGLSFHQSVVEQLEIMFKQVWDNLVDEDFQFTPLLPDDDEPLHIRSTALAGWTQGFLLGFGINKQVLNDASEDVNEAIQDFAEICKMASDLPDSEENENAFFEVHEYVRISSIMCFSELGDNPDSGKNKITLH